MEDNKPILDTEFSDELLKLFFTQFPLGFLLKSHKDFDNKNFVKIKYQESIYAGSIHNDVTLLSQGIVNKQLNIKLVHDQYIISKKRYLEYYSQDILNEMPFLKKLKDESNAILLYYFNRDYSEIVIKFFETGKCDHFMMITFEGGDPISHEEDGFLF